MLHKKAKGVSESRQRFGCFLGLRELNFQEQLMASKGPCYEQLSPCVPSVKCSSRQQQSMMTCSHASFLSLAGELDRLSFDLPPALLRHIAPAHEIIVGKESTKEATLEAKQGKNNVGSNQSGAAASSEKFQEEPQRVSQRVGARR